MRRTPASGGRPGRRPGILAYSLLPLNGPRGLAGDVAHRLRAGLGHDGAGALHARTDEHDGGDIGCASPGGGSRDGGWLAGPSAG